MQLKAIYEIKTEIFSPSVLYGENQRSVVIFRFNGYESLQDYIFRRIELIVQFDKEYRAVVNSNDERLIQEKKREIAIIVDNLKNIIIQKSGVWINKNITVQSQEEIDLISDFVYEQHLMIQNVEKALQYFTTVQSLIEQKVQLDGIENEASPTPPLREWFISDEKYNNVIQILISQGYCDNITRIWKDQRKGNKELLVGILKSLHSKGYLLRKPTNHQVQDIAANTFRADISIDTVKKTNPDQIEHSFIPALA